MSVTIYHNTACSKSRATLALLQENGIQPRIRLYLTEPPTADELRQVLSKLGFSSARQLMRLKDALYQELNLAAPDLTEDELIQALVANPSLIERPIVVSAKGARLGRPPQQVLEII